MSRPAALGPGGDLDSRLEPQFSYILKLIEAALAGDLWEVSARLADHEMR